MRSEANMSSPEQLRRGSEDQSASAVGTPIGVCSGSNPPEWVRIPPGTRCGHVHIIGVPGTGTSSLMEAMILDDVRRGEGVVLLDPHGCMTSRLLCLLPSEAIERTIYFGPGDPDWVPIWNPLHFGSCVDRAHVADGMVRALINGRPLCGDRVDHLLRQVFFALLHLPGGTVRDAATLLQSKSPESCRLRCRILEVVGNECAIHFWKNDYPRYTKADLAAPWMLLSKLLMANNVGAMLSQPASSFDFRDVMDTGKIVFIDLSHVGTAARDVLGSFVLSSLHLTALGRGRDLGRRHRTFNIYCEEAHRFTTDLLEGLLVEMRRFAVNLTLSHQFLGQFGAHMADALSVVGSTIIFRVNATDAGYLAKAVQDKAGTLDLVSLQRGQAIARIDNHVVQLNTIPPQEIPQHHFREEIMARCHQLYCLPSPEIPRTLR